MEYIVAVHVWGLLGFLLFARVERYRDGHKRMIKINLISNDPLTYFSAGPLVWIIVLFSDRQ